MKHIKGNLLDRPEGINIIIHQANINRTMGSGIARQIADRWPKVERQDNDHNHSLGSYESVPFRKNGQWEFSVINLYGQSIKSLSSAGIPTDYNAVIKAFTELNQDALVSKERGTKIIFGVPKYMGCALGGGNWEIYSKIIEETIGKNFEVVCVEYEN